MCWISKSDLKITNTDIPVSKVVNCNTLYSQYYNYVYKKFENNILPKSVSMNTCWIVKKK